MKTARGRMLSGCKVIGLQDSEADVSAEFVRQIKNAGREVFLEVQAPSKHHRSGFMRIDAVVVDDDCNAIAAVEFKSTKPRDKNERGRQIRAYNDLPIPWTYCFGFHGIETAIQFIEDLARRTAERSERERACAKPCEARRARHRRNDSGQRERNAVGQTEG